MQNHVGVFSYTNLPISHHTFIIKQLVHWLKLVDHKRADVRFVARDGVDVVAVLEIERDRACLFAGGIERDGFYAEASALLMRFL